MSLEDAGQDSPQPSENPCEGCAKKDDEIARLKATLYRVQEYSQYLFDECERLKLLAADLVSALKEGPKMADTPKQLREKHERDKAIIKRAIQTVH